PLSPELRLADTRRPASVRHMSPATPTAMTHLAARILVIVAASPGVTLNELCKRVKVRKSDLWAELERLLQVGLLRVEEGYRASECWHPLRGQGNQLLTSSRGAPAVTSNVEVAEGYDLA